MYANVTIGNVYNLRYYEILLRYLKNNGRNKKCKLVINLFGDVFLCNTKPISGFSYIAW